MKYALITGGTSGIGFAMAGEFLDRGYGVILASSSRKNLAIAKRKLEVKKSKIVKSTKQIIIVEQDLSISGGGELANYYFSAGYYNEDASNVNELISDFSATSEELLASISSILESINGISVAADESANGTTNIADRTVSVADKSSIVNNHLKEAEEAAGRLNDEVSKFVV